MSNPETERDRSRTRSLDRIATVLGAIEDDEFTRIDVSLERIAAAAERIADALERAYPVPRPDHAGCRG